MIDVKHIYNIVKHKVGADIKGGDYVITTDTYDSSIFIVPEKVVITKGNRRKILPNPYEAMVVKSDKKDITRRATVNETDEATKEKRIKVRKLNLLGWDEETNTYPEQSNDIIFRQRLIDFSEEYSYEIQYARRGIAEGVGQWRTAKMVEELRTSMAILDRLCAIPPFPAFYDHKYGFLVKRELKMTRLVFEPISQSARDATATAMAEKTNEIVATSAKRDGEMSFKEAIAAEAMKPNRVCAYLEKHGEKGFEMFE